MRKIVISLFFLIFFTSLCFCGENDKPHRFFLDKSIGFGLSCGALNLPTLSHIIGSSSFQRLDCAYSAGFSFKFDYKLSSWFSVMLEHEFINRHLKYESATGSTEINLNQVYVPVLANFHIPLSDRMNVLTALGVGMILNTEKKRYLDAETELVCDNRWECSFVGKAGIEILTKRRMLLLVDYHLSPRANYYYDCAERTENFSIQRLGIEFSIFI